VVVGQREYYQVSSLEIQAPPVASRGRPHTPNSQGIRSSIRTPNRAWKSTPIYILFSGGLV